MFRNHSCQFKDDLYKLIKRWYSKHRDATFPSKNEIDFFIYMYSWVQMSIIYIYHLNIFNINKMWSGLWDLEMQK